MTNNEAIMILESIQPSCGEKYVFSESKRYEAIDMAINALTAETHDKRTEMHACDCVSRQAAIEVINAVFPVDPMKSEYAQGIACGAALAKTYVEQLPSAQPEIIYCRDCRWRNDQNGSTEWLPCRAIVTPSDFYCGRAERKTDE